MKGEGFLGALRQRDFRLLFLGQSISVLGDKIVPLALAFAVLEFGSASDLGLVLAAATVPMVLFVLVGGVYADRLARQWVMVGSDLIRFAAQAVTATLLFWGVANVWHLVVLQAIYGTATAFFQPAATGLVPQTVAPGQLQQANALLSLARNGLGIAGPVIAGILFVIGGAGLAIAFDAATFALSAIFLARLRPASVAKPIETRSVVADLRSGWDEFRSRTWLWTSVLHFSFFHLAVLAPAFVLGPVVAKESLGGASAWATILSAGAVGAVVGGAFALRLKPRRPLVTAFSLIFPWGGYLALLAVPAPLLAIAAVAVVAAGAMTYASTVWLTALQEHVPPHAISRVSSYDWMGSLVFMPVGYALAGPVAAWIGVQTTLAFAAAWLVVSTAALLAVPSVRRLGTQAATEPPATRVVAEVAA